MTIFRREVVHATFADALRRGPHDQDAARLATAATLCLSREVVDEALADVEDYDAVGPRT
jgi:hypothetical protein